MNKADRVLVSSDPALGFLGLGQDVDVPAGQLEARRTFWPRRPMAEGQLVVRHHDFDAAG
jgi:hypothetical protein